MENWAKKSPILSPHPNWTTNGLYLGWPAGRGQGQPSGSQQFPRAWGREKGGLKKTLSPYSLPGRPLGSTAQQENVRHKRKKKALFLTFSWSRSEPHHHSTTPPPFKNLSGGLCIYAQTRLNLSKNKKTLLAFCAAPSIFFRRDRGSAEPLTLWKKCF